MKRNAKSTLLFITGLLLSTLPPIIATLSYFPLWKERGAEYIFSGATLFLILICILPILRIVKSIFKSPSAPLIWLALFLLFFILKRISSEMCIISFWGFISNLLGTVSFKISDRLNGNEDKL